MLTFCDLLRYKSLRKVTLCSSIMFITCSMIYFIPNNIVDQFGFDFYLNGVFIYSIQLIVAPVMIFLIKTVERRSFLVGCTVVILVCSFAILPLDRTSICTHNCWNARLIGEMILFFALRLATSVMEYLIYVYCF